jgi:hypothetical protein
MLQAATKEFVNKWAIQENPNKWKSPWKFLTLVTMIDKATKWGEKKAPNLEI